MRCVQWLVSLSSVCVLAGCPADDAAQIDASPGTSDAGPDATPPDAGLCAGEALFTGSYVDWDGNSSGPTNTLGTEVAQVDDPSASVSIDAPNGRVVMCLPADTRAVVTFTHPDYLPLRYTFEPAAAGTAFDIRGLTPDRADEIFTGLGLARDPLLAQVLVYVRMETASPEAVGAAVQGARVSLGNASAPPYTDVGDGIYGAGDTLIDGAFVLFPNTELGDGTTAVTVTPPDGMTCAGPDSVAVAAGETAVTTFACSAGQ